MVLRGCYTLANMHPESKQLTQTACQMKAINVKMSKNDKKLSLNYICYTSARKRYQSDTFLHCRQHSTHTNKGNVNCA